ncbi:MAG: hypothetical protein ACQETD_09615 [Pseudomonadota bacterium]
MSTEEGAEVVHLPQTLAAWGRDDFAECCRAELEALPHDALPLQQGLALSSCVSDEPFRLMVISSGADERWLRIKAGVFYSGIIAGCSCADDPSPTDVQPEYCELLLLVDRRSGEAQVALLEE